MKKEVELKPIKETLNDFDQVEARIIALLRKAIYAPIMRELASEFSAKVRKLSNSKEDDAQELADAIRRGRVIFWRGHFTGDFSAAVSRELRRLGAVWDRSRKSYKVAKADLPYAVQSGISASADLFRRKIDAIDDRLGKILPEKIASELKVSRLFDQTLWKTEAGFQASVKGITLAPALTKEQAERVSKEWETNLQLYIQDFTQKEILKLRSDLKASVFAGKRYETAVADIQKSYGVSRRKAKFLARQETGLLMAKFKQTRYEAAGVKEYKWGAVAGSPKHPVRPRHKELADASARGKIFRWDNPPNTAAEGEPARMNNPGQDYNCRCFPIPIVRF